MQRGESNRFWKEENTFQRNQGQQNFPHANQEFELTRLLRGWFEVQNYAHNEILCEMFREQDLNAQGWCEIRKFETLREIHELIRGNREILIRSIHAIADLELRKDNLYFRRTPSSQKKLLDRMRDEFKKCFNNKHWPNMTDLHGRRNPDGFLQARGFSESKYAKSICSVHSLCVRLVLNVYREHIQARWLEFSNNGNGVRRRFIHPKVKIQLRKKMEHLMNTKFSNGQIGWFHLSDVLNLPEVRQWRVAYTSEVGKFSWAELIYVCCRYSRIFEIRPNKDDYATSMVRFRTEKLGNALHDVPKRQLLLSLEECKYDKNNKNRKYNASRKDFRVTTFNVLADSLLDEFQFPYTTPVTRDWTRRRFRIMDQIWRLGGSIACLQEVQKNQCGFYCTQFANIGFETKYVPKKPPTWWRENGKKHLVIGNMIAWEKTRWSFIEHKEIHFRDIGKICDPGTYTRSSEQQRRFALDQVAILVKLRRIDNNVVNFCCTHLSAAWQDPDIQVVQCQFLLNELTRLVPAHEPLAICGDFNAVPDHSVYSLITKGNISPKDQKLLKNLPVPVPFNGFSHKLQLKSAYRTCNGREPQITNFVEKNEMNDKFTGCLDYLFCNQHLRVRAVRKLPQQQFLESEFALPNYVFPSDHIPLQAIFTLEVRDEKNSSSTSI